MKICYFGIYQKDYCRNKNIINGLEQNDITVIEVNDTTPGLIKYWYLLKKFWPVRKSFDVMIVGFPGQIIVPFAKILTRKPVVFDLFVSYYDSIILERKKHGRYSWQAAYYYFLDFISSHLADLVLMDTKEHAQYVAKLLFLKEDRVLVIYHGIDNKLFVSNSISNRTEHSKFIISFHGYIQPLNGMDLVMRALKKLEREDIEVWIIGGGMEYKSTQNLAEELGLKKVIFYPPMKPVDLVSKVSQADIGLGFFSLSKKIDRVIANKVYELMALKIPVLTGESRATEEHFKHRKHIYYCQKGSVDAIVEAILDLKTHKTLREEISQEAYSYVQENLTPKRLGLSLLTNLEKTL